MPRLPERGPRGPFDFALPQVRRVRASANAVIGNGVEPSMADEFYDDEQNDQTNSQEGMVSRSQIRALEKKAAKYEEAESKRTIAERKLAMIEAGIDLKTPTGKLFAKAYDGEADTDQIRTAAFEYGLIEEGPQDNADELAAQQRVARASAGAEATGQEPNWDAEYANASSKQEILDIARRRGVRISSDRQ